MGKKQIFNTKSNSETEYNNRIHRLEAAYKNGGPFSTAEDILYISQHHYAQETAPALVVAMVRKANAGIERPYGEQHPQIRKFLNAALDSLKLLNKNTATRKTDLLNQIKVLQEKTAVCSEVQNFETFFGYKITLNGLEPQKSGYVNMINNGGSFPHTILNVPQTGEPRFLLEREAKSFYAEAISLLPKKLSSPAPFIKEAGEKIAAIAIRAHTDTYERAPEQALKNLLTLGNIAEKTGNIPMQSSISLALKTMGSTSAGKFLEDLSVRPIFTAAHSGVAPAPQRRSIKDFFPQLLTRLLPA